MNIKLKYDYEFIWTLKKAEYIQKRIYSDKNIQIYLITELFVTHWIEYLYIDIYEGHQLLPNKV